MAKIISYVKDRYKPQALFITGSDDFLTSKYLISMSMQIKNQIGKTFPVVMPYYWRIFNEKNKNFYNLSYASKQKIALGAGRVYSYGFLVLTKWKIFDIYKNKLLDDRGYILANKYKNIISIIKPNYNQGSIISIKSENKKELNSCDTILKASTVEHKKLVLKEKNEISLEIIPPFFKNFFKLKNEI